MKARIIAAVLTLPLLTGACGSAAARPAAAPKPTASAVSAQCSRLSAAAASFHFYTYMDSGSAFMLGLSVTQHEPAWQRMLRSAQSQPGTAKSAADIGLTVVDMAGLLVDASLGGGADGLLMRNWKSTKSDLRKAAADCKG